MYPSLFGSTLREIKIAYYFFKKSGITDLLYSLTLLYYIDGTFFNYARLLLKTGVK